jgi:squalene-hopene/tetraprenyl-beta-curcumene cyclase
MYRQICATLILGLLFSATANAADRPTSAKLNQVTAKSIQYLKASQSSDGSWSSANGPAVTALCLTALMENGAPASDPSVARGLKYVLRFVQPTGGIHHPQSLYRNYETSLGVLCLVKANTDGRFDKHVKKADKFLKGLQWDEDESIDRANPGYGGGGYGKHKRPDLSNTGFMIEALTATGNDKDSEAIKKALLFVSRCQNLESEHNTTPFAPKNPNGGFYYTPAAGGTSQAGKTPSGGLRSYGSMTYQGLKSMIYAGVGPEDPRVKAATEWIEKNYNLKMNPGLGDAGLYYYYHTFAKALKVMGVDKIKSPDGVEHDWRAELIAEMAKRQRADGSYANSNERWLESDANLVTAYSLLTLAHCR